jgi:raffinose/stachyose/melibiose transport system substrate-binding protein
MQVDSIGFSAIKNTPNLENAEKFIAFVLKQGYQTEVGEIAVPARPDADATEALRYVQQALTDDTVTFIASADGIPNVAPVWGAEVFNPLTQQLALGEISADEFIDQISAKTKEFWEIQG